MHLALDMALAPWQSKSFAYGAEASIQTSSEGCQGGI
jgi:hypothetical protein